MAAHKEYSGTLKLGEGTPSLDAETAVEERLPWEHITGGY
jgi:tRNA pseudouridine55 synthase